MESGFFYPFSAQKRYSEYERRCGGLLRDLKLLSDVGPDDRASLIRLNSSYIDVIDRWYAIRGGVSTILIAVIFGIFAGIFVFVMSKMIIPDLFGEKNYVVDAGLFLILSLMLWSMARQVKKILGREFFTYTHFPIRFNRKTRMIHVFRPDVLGGMLSASWDQVYFHIGYGEKNRELTDIRGHVMDGDNVIDTFAVGHFFGRDEQPVRQIWKFIVVYMEQGPQALPKDMVIGTSTSRSWANCFLWAKSYCDIFLPIPLVNWVAAALVTCMRWLIMQSCKDPVWPAEIEATSAIEPNDPYQWAEPRFTGEFAKDDKVWAAMLARAKRRDRQEH
ncbi:DUF6708 domain-containing protein [Burkholderia ubonensis]|uniref:DUF6708 domain-containing protein n=1 Tax=Burkholderia ubonensis TaxID=101571 RepID=UPI000A7CA2E5|nr:DUF6708 domain-containing protein [Burkholderia ubonensis]